ncbi:MAG: hypothetical protein LBV74_00235 [Tannerella sp.]|nr:hypothetical protein [Tannerella sp.]
MANNNATIYLYFELTGQNLDFDRLENLFHKYEFLSALKGSNISKILKGKLTPAKCELDFFQVRSMYKKISMNNFCKELYFFINQNIEHNDWLRKIIEDNEASIWCSIYPTYCQFGFEIEKKLMEILLQLDVSLGYTISYFE